MAETKIIEIKVNVSDGIKQISQLTTEIDKLTAENKKLDKTTEAGRLQYEANKIAIKEYSNQKRQLTNEVQKEVAASQSALGAYQKLQNEYTKAAAKAKNLAAEYGVESEQAKKASKAAYDMGERLKEIDANVNQHQRNVGNYAGSLEDLNNKYINQLSAVSAFTKANGGLAGSFKAGGQAVAGFGKQLLALLAIPIVAVITAIVGAFMLLKKGLESNGEATRKLNQIFAPFKVLIDAVFTGIGKLVDILLTGVQVIGGWVSNIASLIPGLKQINAEAQEAINLEKEKQRLIREGILDKAQDASVELRISELKKKINQSDIYSKEQRLAFAREVDKLEKQLAYDDAERANRALKNFLQRMKQQGKSFKDYTDEELQEFSDLQANKYKQQQNYYDNTRKNASKTAQLVKSIEDEETANNQKNNELKIKKQDETLTKLETKLSAYQEKNKIITVAVLKEIETQEKNILDKKLEYGKITQDEYNLYRLQSENKYWEAFFKLQDENLAKQRVLINNSIKAGKESLQQSIDDDIASGDESLAKQLNYFAIKKQNEMNYLADRLTIVEGNIDAEAAIKKQQLELQMQDELKVANLTEEQKTAIKEKYAKISKKIDYETFSAKLDIAGQVASGLANLFGKETKAGKFAAAAAVGIDGAQAAFKTGALTAQYIASGNVPMAILSGVQTGVIVANTAKSIADIYKVDDNVEAKAGVTTEKKTINAKYHTGGTIAGSGEIPVTALGGESVNTINTTKMFSPILSALNVMGGGKQITAGVVNSGAGVDMLAESFSIALRNMPAPQMTWKEFETQADRQRKLIENRKAK